MGIKFHKVGLAKNYYYCLQKKCVLIRRPLLSNGIEVKTEEIVTNEVIKTLRGEFSVDLTL